MDYYELLRLPRDAAADRIHKQYRIRMREEHPIKYEGLRNKYAAANDADLLRIIDEKIRAAEEICKQINGAYEVLSDPIKRRKYDEELGNPAPSTSKPSAPPAPDISVSPMELDFGTLIRGDGKSLSFVVENRGGPPVNINIDWKFHKPSWGELIIELDPTNVFPITVTVKVDTTGLYLPLNFNWVVVNSDGQEFTIPVLLTVEEEEVISPTPSSGKKVFYTTPLPGKTMNNIVEILDKLGLGGTVFVVLLVSALLYFGYSYAEKGIASANLANSIAVYDVRRVADGDSYRINFKVRNNSTHYVIVARNGLPWPPSPILCGYWGLGPGATAEATAEDTSSPLCLKFGYEKNGTDDFLVQPGSYYASFGTKYVGPATICSEIFYDSTAEKAAATATAQAIETVEAERVLAIRRETAVANEKMAELKSVANSPNSHIGITRVATFLGSDLPFPKKTGDLYLDRVHKFSTYEEFKITNKSKYTFIELRSSWSSCKCWIPGSTSLYPGESTSAYCMKIMKDVFSEFGFIPYTKEEGCAYCLGIIVRPEPHNVVDARDGCLSIPFSD